MSSIDGINQYFVPNTLDGLNPITTEVSANALLVDGSNSMLADIDAGGHRVKNLQAGVASDEAVNVGQLATYALDSTVVHLAGTETITGNKTFQGTLSAAQMYGTGSSFPTYISNVARLNVTASGTTGILDPGNSIQAGILASNGSRKLGLYPSLSAGAWNGATSNGDVGLISSDNAGLGTTSLLLTTHSTGPSGLKLSATSAKMYTMMDMNAQKITNTANGTVASDVATYGQLTSGLGNYLPLAGGTMSGAINMGAHQINNTADGTLANDVATYGQLTNSLSGYLPISGGTITGNLGVNGNTTLGISTQQTRVNGTLGVNTAPSLGDVHIEGPSSASLALYHAGATNVIYQSSVSTTHYAYIQSTPSVWNPGYINFNVNKPGTASIQTLELSQTSVKAHQTIDANSFKVTNLATGTVSGDAVNLGQLNAALGPYALDSTVVHNTGNETVNGVKTFTSSPVVPVQPTLLTQAASQKMVASTRSASWIYPMAVKWPYPSGYNLIMEQSIMYSPFDIGTVPMQNRSIGSNQYLNELRISSCVMYAGLPVVAIVVRASNYRVPTSSNIQSPVVKVGIWDSTTGAQLAVSSNFVDLRCLNAIPSGQFTFENFYVPFDNAWTPTITKRYTFGVYWSHLNQYLTNSSIHMSTQVNNADIFQRALNSGYTYGGLLSASAFMQGITALPNPIPTSGYTIDTGGLDCMFVVHDQNAIW